MLSESTPILATRVSLIVTAAIAPTIVSVILVSTSKIVKLVAARSTSHGTHSLVLLATPGVATSSIVLALIPHVPPLTLILHRWTLRILLPRAGIRVGIAPGSGRSTITTHGSTTKLLLLVITTTVSTLIASTVTSSIEVSSTVSSRTSTIRSHERHSAWSTSGRSHRSSTHWRPHHSARWESSSSREHSTGASARHHSRSSATSERTSTSSHHALASSTVIKVSTATFVHIFLFFTKTFVFGILVVFSNYLSSFLTL